jgi:hypothetical protein
MTEQLLDKVFYVTKTMFQIENPNWITISGSLFFLCLAVISSTVELWVSVSFLLFSIMAAYAFFLTNYGNNNFIKLTNKSIEFRGVETLFWSFNYSNFSHIEITPIGHGGLYDTTNLFSIIFYCIDGNSYSIQTEFFTKEQINEIKLTIKMKIDCNQ